MLGNVLYDAAICLGRLLITELEYDGLSKPSDTKPKCRILRVVI